MQTTGLFVTHAHSVACRESQPLNLVFFGDVHRDAPLHADEAWQKFLAGAARLPNAVFLGMGDYVDGLSASERHKVLTAGFHESTLQNWEQSAQSWVERMAGELAFMRGRLIGLLEGNHYFSFADGTTSTQRLCRLLDCRYLGVAAFIRLRLARSRDSWAKLDVFAHHGKGAARLVGGSLNRVQQMLEGCDADIVAMGHDHKRAAVQGTPRLRLAETSRGLTVKQSETWLIRSGSFLRGYVDGRASYIADACMSPCNIGHVELEITPHRERGPGRDRLTLDIRGIT